ncbi:unnamed protein product [Rodentolepis nana]|uniref:HUN domain-containing protein n=1 Tax=Rodentolepis nana TaxID=102285 RepID=A0A0R3T489_RODNA|nr:unnamed protein product [Rodentolepis nana]
MADKTFVFELNLDENENNNEFSYLELVKDKLGNRAPSDPFGEDDTTELMEIARQFERKYGDMVTVNKKGRKRKLRVADYRDLGAGYDSGDSFIDDSEYVELVVPPTVRTRFEGFFINTGTLEMLEDKSIDIEAPPPPKQPKLDIPSNKRPAVKKDKSKSATDTQLLERAVKQLSVPNAVASTAAKSSMITNGVSGVTSSLDAVFDSVISAGASADNLITPSPSTQPQLSPIPNAPQSTPSAPPPPTLPPLPDDLNAEVQKLLAMKSTSQGGTAKSLFTPQIEGALLRFDELLMKKNLKKATRSGTYAYMAAKLGIKSKTLLARLRKLKDAQNGSSLDPILDRLRNAVKSAMVDVRTSYERDMGYYQTRLSAWEREKLTNPEAKRPGVPKKKFPFNALCKSYLEAVVSHHMESVFRETKTYPDQDKMKTFFVGLMSIWPEGWISVKKSNGHAASVASEGVNTGGSSLPAITPPVSLVLTPPKLAPPVSATPVRNPPSVASAMGAASAVQSGVAVELSSAKSTTNSNPYVLQFASSSPNAGHKKETPKATVPPFIDLTETNSSSVASNCGKQQHMTSSTVPATPVNRSMNFSPPRITASKSGTSKPTSSVPANSAGPQRRIVLNASSSTNSPVVSSSTVLSRPQLPSVTVPVAQFLGRNPTSSPIATTVSSQLQQQASAFV